MTTRRKNDFDQWAKEDPEWYEGYQAAKRAQAELDDYEALYARARKARRPSNTPWFAVGLLCTIILLGLALLHYRPDLLAGLPSATGKAEPTKVPRVFPTMDAAALELARLNALAAAEQAALNNAIPTEDTSQPPLEPTLAAARQIQQGGIATTVPAGSFSPSDLGNRPVPTPTTMLSQEQFDASQASEEQNFLNTNASGLTPAQQMVQVHDAEQAAQP